MSSAVRLGTSLPLESRATNPRFTRFTATWNTFCAATVLERLSNPGRRPHQHTRTTILVSLVAAGMEHSPRRDIRRMCEEVPKLTEIRLARIGPRAIQRVWNTQLIKIAPHRKPQRHAHFLHPR